MAQHTVYTWPSTYIEKHMSLILCYTDILYAGCLDILYTFQLSVFSYSCLTEARKKQASLFHSNRLFQRWSRRQLSLSLLFQMFLVLNRNNILWTASVVLKRKPQRPDGRVRMCAFLCIFCIYVFTTVCVQVLGGVCACVCLCFIYVLFKHRGFILQQWQMVLNSRQRQEAQGSQHGRWEEQPSIRRPHRRAGVIRFDLCFWNNTDRERIYMKCLTTKILKFLMDPLTYDSCCVKKRRLNSKN